MKQETLMKITEILKGKELFKESNDRARKVLSEIKSSSILEKLEEAAKKYAKDWEELHPLLDPEDIAPIEVSKIDFIEGAKWQKNDCIQFINKLEDESFDGWSEEAISGYLTACMTIKQKYINTLNGN